MGYLDRFLVGALVSVSAVAYYTAPFEIVTRLALIPSAVSGVLFPAFAMSLAQDRQRTKQLLSRGVKYTFLAVFPIVLFISAFAPEILRFWLGAAFAEHGGTVLRWLCIGIFANCLAQMSFALLQSGGRPDIPTKLQLIELPMLYSRPCVSGESLRREWGSYCLGRKVHRRGSAPLFPSSPTASSQARFSS